MTKSTVIDILRRLSRGALARRAGLMILGKRITTEFASFGPGLTRNPRHLDHIPGNPASRTAVFGKMNN